MKTFILVCLLTLIAVSGVVVASQVAGADRARVVPGLGLGEGYENSGGEG